MANGITRTVAFKSDLEMAAAIQDVEAKLAQAEGLAPPRSFVIHSSKGW
jgi:hypothetical protein